MHDTIQQPATDSLSSSTLTRSGRWSVLIWIGISLLVRVLAWWPVAQTGTAPLYDECTYLSRAVAYGNIIRAGMTGHTPEPADWDAAYHNGGWPPLHPLLIGIAFAIAGPSLGLARFVVLLQSAATTGVVYVLGRRLAGRRAALCAAGLHALYPSFIAYSHLLWSETTYILALLSAMYFALRTAGTEQSGRRLRAAIACGTFLGLAGLARAAALPLLIVIPLWIGWRLRPRKTRLAAPLTALVVCVIWLIPWQWSLQAREGRFVALSTAAGYNLYLGNNPWSLEAQSRSEARGALQNYMREHGVSRDEAGRALALQHIRSDVPAFLQRCWSHARAMFVPDWYVLRHMLYASYPPVSNATAYGGLLVFSLSFAVLVAAALAGLIRGGNAAALRSLPLLCVIVGFLPHVLTIANSRMTLPLLALLLPAAGAGLALLNRRRAWIAGAALCLVVLIGERALNPNFPEGAVGTRNQISTRYSALVSGLDLLFGADDLAGKDRVLLRCGDRPSATRLKISATPDDFVLNRERQKEIEWSPTSAGETLTLDLFTPRATVGPPMLRVSNSLTGESAEIQPVRQDAWRRWRSAGMGGLEFMWLGSAGFTDEQIDALLRGYRGTENRMSREDAD